MRAVGQGHCPVSDLPDAVEAALAAPDFVGPMVFFGDLREARINPSVSEVRALADSIGALRESFAFPWIFVTAEPVVFGLLRMLGVFTERHGLSLSIHRELEPALAHAHQLAEILSSSPATKPSP